MIAANVSVFTPQSPSTKPASKRRRWAWIIAALLVCHTTLMLVMVSIATRDKTFAVDSDYYGKAVRWDQDQAIRRASQQLGWTSRILPFEKQDAAGVRQVTIEIADAAGLPLKDAAVEVTYFHHAFGREIRTAELKSIVTNPKAFGSPLLMPHAGLWELQIIAHSGGHEFIKTETFEAP